MDSVRRPPYGSIPIGGRGSGRTYRMLRRAFEAARDGEHVVVAGHTRDGALQLMDHAIRVMLMEESDVIARASKNEAIIELENGGYIKFMSAEKVEDPQTMERLIEHTIMYDHSVSEHRWMMSRARRENLDAES